MNILFYGLGGVGQRHLRNVSHLAESVKLAAIRHTSNTFEIDDNLKVNHNVDIIKKYNISIYHDLSDAINEFKPDIAIIASPSSYHSILALELIKNKIHVFVEKPISTNLENLDSITKYLNKSNTKLCVNYMMRSHPIFKKLRKLIKDKYIGRILSAQFVHNSYFPSWHEYENYQDLYAGKKNLGGGTILTNIHMIDLIYCLFGLPKKVTTIGGRLSSLNIDVEDTIACLLQYEIDDQLIPVTLNLSFVQKPDLNEITINGERGKIILSFDHNQLTMVKDNEVKEYIRDDYKRNDLFVDCLKEFLLSVQKDCDVDTSYFNVIEGHLLALKIKESLNTNKPIKV